MGKYAHCAFLFMVNWLGQCPSAVSQHPASPGTWTHSTAPDQRWWWQWGIPGNMGTSLKKSSQSCTGHRLCFIHCMVPLGCFQMWYIPPVNVFNWQAPGSLFEYCLSL